MHSGEKDSVSPLSVYVGFLGYMTVVLVLDLTVPFWAGKAHATPTSLRNAPTPPVGLHRVFHCFI